MTELLNSKYKLKLLEDTVMTFSSKNHIITKFTDSAPSVIPEHDVMKFHDC